VHHNCTRSTSAELKLQTSRGLNAGLGWLGLVGISVQKGRQHFELQILVEEWRTAGGGAAPCWVHRPGGGGVASIMLLSLDLEPKTAWLTD